MIKPVELPPGNKGLKEMTQQEILQSPASSSTDEIELVPPNLIGKIRYYTRQTVRSLAVIFQDLGFELILLALVFIATRLVAVVARILAH